MTRALARTNFHSSKLMRCLADLAMMEAVAPGDGFAEKLGLWIHFTDAITLSAVHDNAGSRVAANQPALHAAPCAAATLEFDRTQANLIQSITQSCASSGGKSHIKLPVPLLALPLDLAMAYAPYRRFYDAHQHDMTLRIQPLRVNVRDALARSSPRCAPLAELDAALEKILRERERQLLAKVPLLLKYRFEHLFNAHQQRLTATQQTDDPATWARADGWLARFCGDMRLLLLAELDLRLQPTLGLIEAMQNKTNHE